ncbi:MAG: ABC transporter permease [Phycisphaerae bacterium]
MIRHLRLLLLFVRVSLQNDTAYRFDFLLGLATALFHVGGELFGLWIIFHNTRSLAGWSAYQVVVLLGVYRMMSGAINLVIAPNMRRVMEDVRNGTLDFVLLKPINNQFYASCRTFVLPRLADIVLGLGLAIAGATIQAALQSAWQVIAFVVLVAAGVTVIYSVWLALATMTFWTTKMDNIEMVFWNVFEAGRYPIHIYPPAVRWTLTYVIPLAVIVTLPAGVLVGQTSAIGIVSAVAVAAATLAAATAFWRYGLKHYSGASA